MKPMKILYIILFILTVMTIISFLKCRSTNHLRQDTNPSTEDNFVWSQRQGDLLSLANAHNEIGKSYYKFHYSDIEYEEDPRTGLCFARYRDFGFIVVPCGHMPRDMD